MRNTYQYNENIDFLRKMLPSLYVTMESEIPMNSVELEATEEGDNFRVHKDGVSCFLHSLYDVERETDRMLQGIESTNRSLLIFGIGMGHVFDYINNHQLKFDHIIIVEPSLEIFKKFLERKSLEKLLKKTENLSFIVNKSSYESMVHVQELVNNNINTNIFMVSSVAYRTIFDTYFSEFAGMFSTAMNRSLTNVVTTFTITYQRIVNTMHNIRFQGLPAEPLYELLKERPVIMVSAGTSLEANMKYLEAAKDKAVIVAVGTAVQILERNGIRPHLRAALSPHEDTTIFQDMKDFDVPLLYTDTLYHNILPIYTGPIVRMVTVGDRITQYLLRESGVHYTEVVAELSIANFIFESLCWMGCKEIVLVGQDMSFVDNRMYASGSAENLTLGEEHFKDMILAKDVYGKDVYTNNKFLSMKDALIRSMLRNPDPNRKVINCSEGGIIIDGAEFRPLAEQLEAMAPMTGFDDALHSALLRKDEETEATTERMDAVIESIAHQIDEIKDINEDRVATLFKLMKKLAKKNADLQKINKEYQKINRFEEKMFKIPFYNDVVKEELNGLYTIIVNAYKYNGTDAKRQLEAVENILIRTCLEVRKLCNVMKISIDKYTGKEEIPYEFINDGKPKKADAEIADIDTLIKDSSCEFEVSVEGGTQEDE